MLSSKFSLRILPLNAINKKLMSILQTVRFHSLRRFLPDFNVSHDPSLRLYRRIMTISAFSLAIGLGIALQKYLVFEFHDNSGVVGWISVNQYPKQQEFFYYLLALVGIPISIWLYWLGWLAYSQWAAKKTDQPIQRVLKLNALASVPLWLCWLQVYYFEHSGFLGLTLPIGLTLIFKLVLLCVKYYPISPYPDTVSAEPVPPQNEETRVSTKGLRLFRRVFEYVLVPIFIYLLIYNSNINGGIDMFHEGERLAPLNEMLHGGVVFRDVYVQHGLFQNAYLAWFGGKFFEPTLMGVRSMERVVGPLGYVALYLLGLQVFRGRFITAFLCFLIVSGSHFFASARHSLGFLSFACVANYLTYHRENGFFAAWQGDTQDKPKWVSRFFSSGWKLILGGILTSLAFWYSTEVGLYTLGGIGLFLVIYSGQHGIPLRIRPLPLISYCCGLLLGFLPVAIYFLSHGALDDAIWNSYIQCKYQLATWGLKFPSLSATLAIIPEQGWQAFILSGNFRWYLPICVFMVTAAYLTYRWLCGRNVYANDALKLLLLLLGGIAFFRTALGRSDGGHLNFGSTFLWPLCLFPLDRKITEMFHNLVEGGYGKGLRERLSLLTDQARWRNVLIKAAWILIPIVICVWYVGEVHHPLTNFKGNWQRVRQNPFKRSLAPEELARAGQVDIPDDQVEQIQKVVAYIQENTLEGEKIFDFTSQGAYYFFANRPSVTRFHMVSYASTPGMQREVVSALERDQTRLVIFKTGGWFDRVDGIPVEERHPLIAEYLEENYELAIDINKTEILLRK